MSFLDGVTSAINNATKGPALAKDPTMGELAEIEERKAELSRSKRDLMADLGESIYEDVASTGELLEGREEIVQGIQELDEQLMALDSRREEIERQREELERQREELERQHEIAAASSESCPRCGYTIQKGWRFCMNCGNRIERCGSCGSVVSLGQRFCAICGFNLQGSTEEADS